MAGWGTHDHDVAPSLSRVLEEAVLLQAALALLDHGLRAVGRDGDGPLVARMGAAFGAP